MTSQPRASTSTRQASSPVGVNRTSIRVYGRVSRDGFQSSSSRRPGSHATTRPQSSCEPSSSTSYTRPPTRPSITQSTAVAAVQAGGDGVQVERPPRGDPVGEDRERVVGAAAQVDARSTAGIVVPVIGLPLVRGLGGLLRRPPGLVPEALDPAAQLGEALLLDARRCAGCPRVARARGPPRGARGGASRRPAATSAGRGPARRRPARRPGAAPGSSGGWGRRARSAPSVTHELYKRTGM